MKLPFHGSIVETRTDTQFNVTVSLNGGAEQTLTTTAETGLKMANPEPGGTYTFKVVAVRGNQQSNAATASVKIPEAVPEEPEQTRSNDGR